MNQTATTFLEPYCFSSHFFEFSKNSFSFSVPQPLQVGLAVIKCSMHNTASERLFQAIEAELHPLLQLMILNCEFFIVRSASALGVSISRKLCASDPPILPKVFSFSVRKIAKLLSIKKPHTLVSTVKICCFYSWLND